MSTFDSIGQEDLDRVRELAEIVSGAHRNNPGRHPLHVAELAERAAALVHDVEAERRVARMRAADQAVAMRGSRPDRPMTLEEIEAAHALPRFTGEHIMSHEQAAAEARRLYEQASEPDPWLAQAPEYQGSIAAHLMRPGWLTGGRYSPCCGAPVTPSDPGDGIPACSHCHALIEHTEPNG